MGGAFLDIPLPPREGGHKTHVWGEIQVNKKFLRTLLLPKTCATQQ